MDWQHQKISLSPGAFPCEMLTIFLSESDIPEGGRLPVVHMKHPKTGSRIEGRMRSNERWAMEYPDALGPTSAVEAKGSAVRKANLGNCNFVGITRIVRPATKEMAIVAQANVEWSPEDLLINGKPVLVSR